MPTRPQLFMLICNLVGAPVCKPINAGTGWPGIAEVTTTSGNSVRVAMHVSVVGSHSRAAYEKRFQNPADRKPVSNPQGALPLLVGLAQVGAQPVLVGVDGSSRLGRQARFSILFRDDILTSAATNGWAEYQSSTGERIFAFHPKLLGIFVEAVMAGVFPNAQEVAQASLASGVVRDNTEEAAERARAVASRLVRDARFSKEVRAAYQDRCAMCGLDMDLVVGAHICPAATISCTKSAPDLSSLSERVSEIVSTANFSGTNCLDASIPGMNSFFRAQLEHLSPKGKTRCLG